MWAIFESLCCMVKETDFDIPISGLKIGTHQFVYEIDDLFFELFDYTELKDSALTVSIELTKKVNLLTLDYHVHGQVTLSCDTCSDDYMQPIEECFNQIVKITDWQEEETNDEIIYLSSQQHTLSLSHSIYEFVCLSLPRRRAHSSVVECNQEMINTLNQYQTIHTKEDSNFIDPRWAKLTELKN